jgi:hypothetical protein
MPVYSFYDGAGICRANAGIVPCRNSVFRRAAASDCSVDGVRNRRSGSVSFVLSKITVFSIGPNCDTCLFDNFLVWQTKNLIRKTLLPTFPTGERSSFHFEKIWISVLLILEKEERGEQ